MNETVIAAKIALANTFVLYFKAQSYHWNVEGMFISQFHDFFGELYEEVYGAVDPMAEEIRALGAYAPRSLNEMYQYKTINDLSDAESVQDMLADLVNANATTIESLNKLFDLLFEEKKQGFADFVAGRIDAHEKHGWMLRSFLK